MCSGIVFKILISQKIDKIVQVFSKLLLRSLFVDLFESKFLAENWAYE